MKSVREPRSLLAVRTGTEKVKKEKPLMLVSKARETIHEVLLSPLHRVGWSKCGKELRVARDPDHDGVHGGSSDHDVVHRSTVGTSIEILIMMLFIVACQMRAYLCLRVALVRLLG